MTRDRKPSSTLLTAPADAVAHLFHATGARVMGFAPKLFPPVSDPRSVMLLGALFWMTTSIVVLNLATHAHDPHGLKEILPAHVPWSFSLPKAGQCG
jgi:hypothetical protein